jgi:hypothetical protein
MAPQSGISLVKNARLYRPTPACTDVPGDGFEGRRQAVFAALQDSQAAPLRSLLRLAAGAGRGRAPWVQAARAPSGQRDRGGGLPGRLSSLGDNGGVDPAAHIEARREAQKAWLHGGLEMVGDLVGHRLVKSAALAE